MCCFFQAEDGIRDLVRSRGLGDVYKRQSLEATAYQTREVLDAMEKDSGVKLTALKVDGGMAVSYTHLTLPTSDLV